MTAIEKQFETFAFKITECPCADHPKDYKEIFIAHPSFPECKAAIEFPRNEGKNEGNWSWWTYTLEAIEFKGNCYQFKYGENYEEDDAEGFLVFQEKAIPSIVALILKNFREIEMDGPENFEIFKQIQENRQKQRKEGMIV